LNRRRAEPRAGRDGAAATAAVPGLSSELAAKLAGNALDNVTREFPNKLGLRRHQN
jgi:hypothetical protein